MKKTMKNTMKIFAIRDESADDRKDLAYLIYFENTRSFYIELPDMSDEWEVPLLLSSFVKKGEHSVNSYWSRLWVTQRIVPTDRQNIGQILKDNGLSEYDEMSLLLMNSGRCTQDSYYLSAVSNNAVTQELLTRFRKKVEDVVPLEGCRLLITFRNGSVRKCDIKKIVGADRTFAPVLADSDIFETVSIQPDGYGVQWGENLLISYERLYSESAAVSLMADDIRSIVKMSTVNTGEAAKMLGCSRQNIADLVKRGKLFPVKSSSKEQLFMKSDIMKRC